jgi:hypothetical protein
VGIPTQQLIQAASVGDEEELARGGIDVRYAQLNQVFDPLVSGARFVEIETVGPYAAHHVVDGRLDVSFENMPNDERTGILLASILRDALSGLRNLRVVALLDDLHDAFDKSVLTSDERDRYVVQMAKILYAKGVFSYDDVPGSDYRLLRESAHLANVDILTERLHAHGTVETTETGNVIFHPDTEWLCQLGLRPASQAGKFSRRGILLKKAGKPTCQALDAAGFLNPTNQQIIHFVILNTSFRTQQDKTYTLLRALDIVRGSTYHNVFFDSDTLTPELIAFTLCELFIHELRTLSVDKKSTHHAALA